MQNTDWHIKRQGIMGQRGRRKRIGGGRYKDEIGEEKVIMDIMILTIMIMVI